VSVSAKAALADDVSGTDAGDASGASDDVYTYFWMEKRNREQLNALEIVADHTATRLSEFGYVCGLRLRAAYTCVRYEPACSMNLCAA
jgi:tRNA(Glu) U13 pseudouridine synthase TruD